MGAENDIYGAGPQGLANLGVEFRARHFSPEARLARKVGAENVGSVLAAIEEQVRSYTGRNKPTHIEITHKKEVHGEVVLVDETRVCVPGDEDYIGTPMNRTWDSHHHSRAHDITPEVHTLRIEHMPVSPDHPLTDRKIMEKLLEGRYLSKETLGRILMRNKGILAEDKELEEQATMASPDEVKKWLHDNKIRIGNISEGLTHDVAMNIFDELTSQSATRQAA